MVDGLGVDIVNIKRFKRALDRWGEKFTRRIFTEEELSYCMFKRRPEWHLAARFAAKEAFIKAISTHVGPTHYRFREIEIKRMESGTPYIHIESLKGRYRILLSLSHDTDYCIAQVIIVRHP